MGKGKDTTLASVTADTSGLEQEEKGENGETSSKVF